MTRSAPTTFAKSGEIDSGWSIPPAHAITGAELHCDLLVAVRNLQGRRGHGIRLREPRRGEDGLTFSRPAFLRWIGGTCRRGRDVTALCARRRSLRVEGLRAFRRCRGSWRPRSSLDITLRFHGRMLVEKRATDRCRRIIPDRRSKAFLPRKAVGIALHRRRRLSRRAEEAPAHRASREPADDAQREVA